MKKIMVVDDEPDQIYVVSKILENSDMDVKVVGAIGGKACFKILEQEDNPDLILLDIMMPDMSGWDVLDRLQKSDSPWKNIRVVFFTACSEEIEKNGSNYTDEDFIRKPFNRNDLKERITKILKNVS